MIKFVNKKYIRLDSKTSHFTIYYSVSDIVLGILLIGLVSIFICNYWTTVINPKPTKYPVMFERGDYTMMRAPAKP